MAYLYHGLTDYKSMIVKKTETNFLSRLHLYKCIFKQKL